MLDGSVQQTAFTLTAILGWAREISIIGVLLGAAWKARGVWDDAKQFLDRIEIHMTKMENFAEAVVNNHLVHMEEDMRLLAQAEKNRQIEKNRQEDK